MYIRSNDLLLKESKTDLSRYVTDEGRIWSLRGDEKVSFWNNIEYGAGLSGKIHVTKLSMNRHIFRLVE